MLMGHIDNREYNITQSYVQTRLSKIVFEEFGQWALFYKISFYLILIAIAKSWRQFNLIEKINVVSTVLANWI